MSDTIDSLAPEHSVAYSLEQLVGRTKEREAIRQAAQSGVRVVYIEGDGGIGKTRLLDEVDRFVQDLQPRPVVLGIVDFYDTTMHGSLALEETLARQMQQQAGGQREAIQTFLSTLDQYRMGADIDQDQLHTAFTEAFNRWAGERWVMLRFDTAEFLEYGQDEPEVLEECEVWGEEASVVTWLRTRLPTLERATALIAARPTQKLRLQLEDAYSEDLWQYLPLGILSLDDAVQYFQTSGYGRRIDEEMIERIWLLTNGRPIMLSLSIDWLVRGIQVDEIYDVNVKQLSELKEKENEEEWQRYLHRFEQALVSQFRHLATPMDAAVYYAARARKGFTTEMLRQMLQELPLESSKLTLKQAQELMESLAKLSFVKQPHGARPGWFFLHDEMYDLLDRHVWEFDYPEYTHQAETARFLAEQIYGEEDGEGLIGEAAERVRAAEAHTELIEARRQLEILRTEQLFYWLEADPAGGYQLYDRLDTQAISQRRREWDEMLRIEVLRFMRTLPRQAQLGGLVDKFDPQSGELTIAAFVNRDTRARWVHRFLARGDPEKAERIACHLMDLHPDWGGFWQARVLVGRGAALVRMGEPESIARLQEALEILQQPQLEGDPWAIRHYTATAYLYLGLRARAEWNVKRAAEVYEKAQGFFEENDEPIGAARALNNLAYVVALQGDHTQAIQAARKAARLRDELGDVVGTGLSLNTLAIAEDWAGTSARAWTHAREALSLLRRAQQMGRPGLEREIAMVHLNLSRIRRHLARREALREIEVVEKEWRRAEEHLKEVLERESALEPYYRFGLYNQFGLLWSNWANWIALRIPEEKDRYRALMEQASLSFEQADRFAREESLFVDRADNLEDWAWVFHLRRAYREVMGDDLDPAALERETLDRLKEAEDLIRDLADPGQEGLRVYYVAGSVHHQWGRYFHKFTDDVSAALRRYALSIAYYDQFTLEPVGRRDRVLEHLENAFAELPADEVEQSAQEMLRVVEERHLPARELRSWIENTVADISLR